MSKSGLVVLVVAALIAGCVSVSGPSAAPTLSPTPPIITQAPATASPGPTALPTAAPTVTAAPSPTVAPASATPQPTTDLGFDQRDVLFSDDLADPASGWGVGDISAASGAHVGSVGYVDGALEIALDHDGGWAWSRRLVNSSNATLRIAAEFIPTSDGRFGLLCASSDAELYGVLVGTDGSWAFVRVSSDGAEELLGDAGAGLNVAIGEATLVAIDCAGLATGSLRLTLWLGESGPVAMYEANDGPDSFDRAATYAEAAIDGFSVGLANVIAFGTRSADGQLTADGQQLLTHVPVDWQDRCYQSLRPPYLGGTAETVLTCFLGAPGHDGAEIAEFAAFLTVDAMNRAYQNRIDAFGTGSGATSCAVGSDEQSYIIGGTETGRLLCVDQLRGIRFDWTDTRLNILATLVDLDGDYGLTFADWNSGGPNL